MTPGAYASWGGGSAIFRQDRERTTGNLTLQARPNANTDISLNYMNSDMSMDNSNQNYLWEAGGLADAKGNIQVTNPKFITTSDGTKALVGGTVGSDGRRVVRAYLPPVLRQVGSAGPGRHL